MKRLAICIISTVIACAGAFAQNWPQFRGPLASGVAEGRSLPITWTVEESVGLIWKTAIPGLGHSSPVVWGDRVFVTTAISANPNEETHFGEYTDVDPVKIESQHTWKIYALDRRSGRIIWERIACEGLPKVKRHPNSTHATSTPATDGKHLVVLFGSEGLFCFDLSGKPIWKKNLGILDSGWFFDPDYQWEHGSSPIIYRNLVIVQADIQKNSFIAAYDIKTGEQVWKTSRDELPSWGTPAIFEVGGRAELVTNGTKAIRGYDPATGKELWRLSPNSEITATTPFAAGGLVYVTSAPYKPVQPIYAIRPGATGDISLRGNEESNRFVAWSKRRGGSFLSTPIVYRGLLYVCAKNGILTAYDANTGERAYQERLVSGGGFTASPVAADGKLYFASEDGEVVVVKAGPKYEVLAINPIGEVVMATPAISGGLVIVRGVNHLFAFGVKPAAKESPKMKNLR